MTAPNLRYGINEPDVTAESFEDEVIAINLANGRYHSLRGSGAWLWHALTAGLSRKDAIAQLCAQSDTPSEAAAQAAEFIDRLAAEELIVAAPERSPGDFSALTPLVGFLAPLMETFTDMENLLAIDPIHEVDMQAGWPHAPGQS
jgi:hypothetical protein